MDDRSKPHKHIQTPLAPESRHNLKFLKTVLFITGLMDWLLSIFVGLQLGLEASFWALIGCGIFFTISYIYVRLHGWSFIPSLLAPYSVLTVVFIAMINGRGLHDTSIYGLSIVILLDATLIGRRGSIIISTLCCLGIIIVYIMEIFHQIPKAVILKTDYVDLLVILVTTITSAMIAYSFVGFLEKINLDLSRNVKQKEIMLREIHHRVKNNFQTVLSMISIHEKTDSTNLELLRQRIFSMALVHENIYQDESFSRMDFGDFLRRITIQSISSIHGPLPEIITDIDDNSLTINQAISLGMLCCELIRRTFPEGIPKNAEKSCITIKLKHVENTIYFYFEGEGIANCNPDDIDLSETIISAFVSQLNAQKIKDIQAGPNPIFHILIG